MVECRRDKTTDKTAQGDSEAVRTAAHMIRCGPPFSLPHCLPASFCR